MILEMAVGGIVGYLIGSSRKKAQANPIEGRGYDILARTSRNRIVRDYAPTRAMAEGKARQMRLKYGSTKIYRRA